MGVDRTFRRPYSEMNYTIEELVEECLEGSDHERGAVEEAQAEAENVKKAFGRLLRILYEKQKITKRDIYFIVHEYIPEDFAFMKDSEDYL